MNPAAPHIPKPCWAIIEPSGTLLPFTVRHTRGECIADEQRRLAQDWLQLRQRGYRVIPVNILPAKVWFPDLCSTFAGILPALAGKPGKLR